MKRKEFIRIVTSAMEAIQASTNAYTCNELDNAQPLYIGSLDYSPLSRDYQSVFSPMEGHSRIPLGFGVEIGKVEERKQARLNALAMYLAQSLAFKTYKDL